MPALQARFTEALLRGMAKVPVPNEDIHSTTLSGQPKSDILLQLAERHPGAACHFVEDKLSTLEKARPWTPSLRVHGVLVRTGPQAACIPCCPAASSSRMQRVWLRSCGPVGRLYSRVRAMTGRIAPGCCCILAADCSGTMQVCKVPELSSWALYLVNWGYNTAEERARAAANPRIEVVDKARLKQLVGL